MYTYIHTHTQTRAHPHIYTYIHTHPPTYTYTRPHTHIYTYTHTHTHTQTRTYPHIYTYIHTHPPTYTYTRPHTHTFTHTYTHTLKRAHTHIFTRTFTPTHQHTRTHAPPHTHTDTHIRVVLGPTTKLCVFTLSTGRIYQQPKREEGKKQQCSGRSILVVERKQEASNSATFTITWCLFHPRVPTACNGTPRNLETFLSETGFCLTHAGLLTSRLTLCCEDAMCLWYKSTIRKWCRHLCTPNFTRYWETYIYSFPKKYTFLPISKIVIKLTVVIVEGYHCYQLHTKFYPIFSSRV